MKINAKKILISAFVASLFVPVISFAHPGRTDASGCHTCRTNCPSWGLSTGEYHCHRAKALPQPKAPIKSTFGEGGTGYTTLAPEYKTPSNNIISQPQNQPAAKSKTSFFGRIFSWLGWR